MGGSWWRFTDYLIDDLPVSRGEWPYPPGYIRPSPDARLEAYQVLSDPDAETGESHLKPTGDKYQSLLDLNVDDDAAILSWCRQYGLLGILPQESVQLRLAPRWRLIGFSDSAGHRRALSAYQTIYSRTPAGWQGLIESMPWNHMELEGNEDYEGRLAEPAAGVSSPSPIALMTQLFSITYEERRLGEAVGRFFPQVPVAERDTALYPHPLSEDFWHQYCEPLEEFRWAVKDFQTMMDNLSHAGPSDVLLPRDRAAIWNGQGQLNSLLSVYPSLWIEFDGTSTPRWAFPSLLAIFAFEVWQKLIGGQSIRHCKRSRCRRLFLAAQYNREYCSDRCRQAEEKARQRRRNQTT